MAVKILVSSLGHHIIADAKVVENAETKERIAYWVAQARVIGYNFQEDGTTNISFAPFCLGSDENEFSIREDFIVSVLEPRADILEHWKSHVYDNTTLTATQVETDEQPSDSPAEDGSDADQ